MIHRILILTFAALLILVAPACSTIRGSDSVANYNAAPLTVVIPADKTPLQVQNAMGKAFEGRGWTVIQSSPEETIAQLDHRGIDATATMDREGNTIKILCEATMYVQQRGEDVPVVPKGWLENLEKDLKTFLGRYY